MENQHIDCGHYYYCHGEHYVGNGLCIWIEASFV